MTLKLKPFTFLTSKIQNKSSKFTGRSLSASLFSAQKGIQSNTLKPPSTLLRTYWLDSYKVLKDSSWLILVEVLAPAEITQ